MQRLTFNVKESMRSGDRFLDISSLSRGRIHSYRTSRLVDRVDRSPTSSTTSTSIPPTPSTTSEATLAAERHRILGNKAVSSGDFEKAVDEYSRAIQLHPSNAVYLANRSYAYFALSRYHAALIDAEQSVAADPTYWKGWSRLGAARKAVGEYSDAKTAYKEAQGGGKGAEATRRDSADVTRLLEERTDRAGTSTSRLATDVPSAASTSSPAANSSSLRPATFGLPPQTSASTSPRPTLSTSPPTSSSSAAHPVNLSDSQTSSQSGSITSQAVPPSLRRPTPIPRGPSASITTCASSGSSTSYSADFFHLWIVGPSLYICSCFP